MFSHLKEMMKTFQGKAVLAKGSSSKKQENVLGACWLLWFALWCVCLVVRKA